MFDIKGFIITLVIIIGIIVIYEFRYHIKWFLDVLKVTLKNHKGVKDIQKKGMNIRNLKDEELIKYIEESIKILKHLNIDYTRKFVLDEELERHLRYSRFSEKYVYELLSEILSYMNLEIKDINLKINYISSKYQMSYAGLYSEEENGSSKRNIVLNIQNDMTMSTIISIIAHECTHHLLLSNNIRLKDRLQNECLTDVTAVMIGFGKYMVQGYKISNRVIYDEINHRSIKKDRIGYLSYKDIEFVFKRKKKF